MFLVFVIKRDPSGEPSQTLINVEIKQKTGREAKQAPIQGNEDI